MNKEQVYNKLLEAEVLSGDCRENFWLAHTYQKAETLDKLKKDFNRLKALIAEVDLSLNEAPVCEDSV